MKRVRWTPGVEPSSRDHEIERTQVERALNGSDRPVAMVLCVVCDAFRGPDKHDQLLPGAKSKLVEGWRPSMRFLAPARDVTGGIAGNEASRSASEQQHAAAAAARRR